MNRYYKKVKNYNKLSDYSDLIPHYYTKLIGVFILLGICIISVNLLDPLIFGEFMFVKSISFNSKEKLIIALIAFISISTVLYIGRGILKVIEDLENQNKDEFKERVNSQSNKLKIKAFKKDKDNYPLFDSSPNKEKQDIFTSDISNNDPLWRVRAYVIGFLLADGSISTPSPQKVSRSYIVSASQHIRDIDILNNIQMVIGGKISDSYEDNICYLNAYGKDLVLNIQDFGMVERHTNSDIAINILPPQFINISLNGQTLVRDFVRGYFDGDGCFFGNYSNRSTRFYLPGSEVFLKALNSLILNEIPDLTTFITPEKIRIYTTNQKEFRVYGGLKIYIKDSGFYQLTELDLDNGIIETKEHPWLKRLHIAGSFNCIKFFNWLYCDDDFFDDFEINGIHICGQRKFNKSLNVLGNSLFRRERLAPNWNDMLFEIIPKLQSKYYKVDELMQITNELLLSKLTMFGLEHIYENNSATNRDIFRTRLKYLEYRDHLLESFQQRIGRSNVNFYFSKLNPPQEIPLNFRKKIELVDNNGYIKTNLKNLIIFIFLHDISQNLNFNELAEILIDINFFKESTLRPNRILLDLAELKTFDILLNISEEDVDISKQDYVLNISILPKYYDLEFKDLKEIMESYFPIIE